MCSQKLFKKKKVKQESFNANFGEVNHNVEDDLEVRLIGQADNLGNLEKENLFGKMDWILFNNTHYI